MKKPLFTRSAFTLAALVALAAPAMLSAQGGRGGYGGGGTRGQRGQRDQSDSTTARAPRTPMSLTDVVYTHRSELQLTDSQTTRVADIRMVAMSRTISLNRQLDSLRSAMVVTPAETATAPTDSSRKATMDERRAFASVLGQLHDVDLNARNETLAVLTSDQQKKAEQMEINANAPPADHSAQNGGRSGGGRRGGGMGGGNGVPFLQAHA